MANGLLQETDGLRAAGEQFSRENLFASGDQPGPLWSRYPRLREGNQDVEGIVRVAVRAIPARAGEPLELVYRHRDELESAEVVGRLVAVAKVGEYSLSRAYVLQEWLAYSESHGIDWLLTRRLSRGPLLDVALCGTEPILRDQSPGPADLQCGATQGKAQ